MSTRSLKRYFDSTNATPKRPRLVVHEDTDSEIAEVIERKTGGPLPLMPIVNESDRPSQSQAREAQAHSSSQQISDTQSSSSTDLVSLDSSLPKITDADAIRQEEENGERKSSLYVDAFNLALETVLEEESFLFSEEEMAIFDTYKKLDYEAQYLYVRLFLRKTNAWFRVGKLGYFYDIKEMPTACATLQSEDVRFAVDESYLDDLEDAANLVNLDELKSIAKEAKIGGGNKGQLVASLKRQSSGQGKLEMGSELKLKYDGKGNKENRRSATMKKLLEITGNMVHLLLEIELNFKGPCIKLTEHVSTLFARVHLVFYRSTEWTEKSLTTLILARIMRRNFPNYFVCRTSNIFPTRKALLDFENAIKLQNEVDGILEFGVPTKDDLKRVVEIMDLVYDDWEQLCISEAKKDNIEEVYLRRFSAAWVYTRLVHKGVYVLGRFKDYPRERKVLKALLEQRLFHPSRRGGWYQRLALIEEHYFHDETTKRKWLQTSLDTAEAGLQDPDTHVIYHYDLQKRISKLEKKLNVAKKDQHMWVWALRKPGNRTIYGHRIRSDTENGREIGRKTVWRIDGPEGDVEVSVEEMCLSTYRKEGWKGFHSEGGIIRTIFAYLFYDIMFLPLPNIFQTAFQTCPLDLHTDSFYGARASEINHRLVEISNGEGPRYVRQLHASDGERKPCIIGLDWNFEVDEICEIVECIGGEALAVICKVLCQEYKERGSGLPDLFLWNAEEKKAKFAEVKSENDRLSDTQRLWIDVLIGAGVDTELCSALDERDQQDGKAGASPPKGKGKKDTPSPPKIS